MNAAEPAPLEDCASRMHVLVLRLEWQCWRSELFDRNRVVGHWRLCGRPTEETVRTHEQNGAHHQKREDERELWHDSGEERYCHADQQSAPESAGECAESADDHDDRAR